VNGNPSTELTGVEELPGKSNYLFGTDPSKWHVNVPMFRKVRYRSVYPGIDLLYYGNHRTLEYDFVIAPHTDPGKIRVRVEGARQMKRDADGSLVIETAAGDFRMPKPILYQEIDGTRREVGGKFLLMANREIRFAVGPYNARHALVIDPQLVYSTYLGGSGIGGDYANAIAVDSSGNAYVAGRTRSTDFPTTAGALKTSFGTGVASNAFVAKLNSTGTALVYSTYLGGSLPGASDEAAGISVDTSGNAYVTGHTTSADFPTTTGAFQTALHGLESGFVSKLNTTGTGLIYSTYLGGANVDLASAIAVDTSGQAYVTGYASSPDFPTTPGAYRTTNSGAEDVFVSKFNAAGSALLYSSYLGGSSNDVGNGIAIDSAGNAYVTGSTFSSNYPVTSGAFQTAFGGSQGPFLTKLNSTGSSLVFSTFIGGFSFESASAVAVDGSGNAYITGFGGSSFPTTPGAYKSVGNGSEIFVSKFNATGTALIYSTFIGGPGSTEAVVGNSIAVDAAGNAYVAGSDQSNDYPTTPGAYQTVAAGYTEGVVSKLDPTGSTLLYSTFLGGNDTDSANAIALDANGNIYITGETASTNFPVSPGAFQTTNNSPSRGNAFVTELTPPAGAVPGVALSTTSLTFSNQTTNTTSAPQPVKVTNSGTAELSITAVAATGDFSVSGNCISSSPIAPNGTCTENVTFMPTATGPLNGSLSFTDDAANSPQFVTLAGTGVPPAPTATTTALTSSTAAAVVGTSVTFTATVTGATGTPTPTGTVTFNEGSTMLGSGTVNASAVATYSTSALAAGSHTITASYGGDTRNLASASSDISVTVWPGPPDFTVSLSPTSSSVKAGKSATTTVMVSSMNGFGSATTLTCTGLPKNSKCNLSSSSVTPSMAGSATSTLTFETNVKPVGAALASLTDDLGAASRRRKRTFAAAGILALFLLIPSFGSNARKLRRMLLSMIIATVLALGMADLTGCGGGPTTPKGTYSIVVTATANGVAHSATYTVTVQ